MAEFDMSLVQRGARLRHSPYYEATQAYSPRGFTVYNHMLFPIRFESFEEEFQTLLNDVTVWDVSVERNPEISGPDAYRFMSLLTPRVLSGCRPGQGKYVLLTADDVTRRTHYANARRTLERLLDLRVLPIVNENDTVATSEIRFGDNDRLAALVAHLIDVGGAE